MNLQKLFKAQKKLDSHIEKEKGLEGVDLLDKKILALQVELGELANELPEVFKFWSDKKNNYEKALEEYVDCIHFAISIGNDLEVFPTQYDLLIATRIDSQFKALFYRLSNFANTPTQNMYLQFLGTLEGLGKLLGFTSQEIEQAYFEKHQVNYDRQKEGY